MLKGDEKEFIGQTIDIIQDFATSTFINIDYTIIDGDVYNELEQKLKELYKNWGVI